MKTLKLLVLFSLCVMSGCVSLKPTTYTGNLSLTNYKYIYIVPTAALSSSSGSVYGNDLGVWGATVSKSINPADIISGILMKRGYTILPELVDDLRDRTLIISYGETGRRGVFWGYTIEITLQILSADTHEVLCTCTAEGFGETEADDIRIAIKRAMDTVFPN